MLLIYMCIVVYVKKGTICVERAYVLPLILHNVEDIRTNHAYTSWSLERFFLTPKIQKHNF
jgi:hypothetical protein